MKENKTPGIGTGVMILKNGKILLGKRNTDPQKQIPNCMEKECGLCQEVRYILEKNLLTRLIEKFLKKLG
jgi:hypothetical protein